MSGLLFSEATGYAGSVGLITLNRPQALNALNDEMIKALTTQLAAWAVAPHIKAVVICSNSEKAFCAGGDIRNLYKLGRTDQEAIKGFFYNEYRLNYQIAKYPKPYIAFLDGITMGGGAGISIHGSLRLATDNLAFAMPETGIGFFPDIGASYFLSRCPDQLGLYIGLTGTRLTAADAFSAKLVDNIVAKDSLPGIIQAIANNQIQNTIDINTCINDYLIPAAGSSLARNKQAVKQHFSHPSLEAIMLSLQEDTSTFAQQTLTTLLSRSPTSLRVTYETITQGQTLDLAACLQMEFGVMQQFLNTADLYEGIRAAIIEKDSHPHWNPCNLSLVSDLLISSFFTADNKETLPLDFY